VIASKEEFIMTRNYIKLFVAIVLAVVILIPLNSFADKRNPTPEKPLVLKMATFFSPNDIRQKYTEKWGDAITEVTGGAIKFKYFPSQQLVKAKEMSDSLQAGIIDSTTHLVTAYTPEDYPFSAAVLLLPFAVPDKFESVSGLARDAESVLFSEFASHNIQYLWSMFSSYGQEWFFKDPFDPKDPSANFAGKKVRSPGIVACKVMVKSLGAERVKMSSTEVYEAGQKGIIQGCTLGFSQYVGSHTYEVFPYVLWGGSTFTVVGGVPCVMRKDLFDSLPEKMQADIIKVSRNLEKEFFYAYRAEVDSLKEKLIDQGKIKQLLVMDDATKVEWKKQMDPLVEKAIAEKFPKRWAELKKVLENYQQ
jgi:TRAP-type C4-dicarboxylate transport system substrate-binding protein